MTIRVPQSQRPAGLAIAAGLLCFALSAPSGAQPALPVHPIDLVVASSRPASMLSEFELRTLWPPCVGVLWHRLTEDSGLVPQFVEPSASAVPADVRTGWLVALVRAAESRGIIEIAGLADLMEGLWLMKRGQLADADVAFSHCRLIAIHTHRIGAVCGAFQGMLGTLVARPSRVGDDWRGVAATSARGGWRRATFAYAELGPVASEPFGAAFMTGLNLLAATKRIDFGRTMAIMGALNGADTAPVQGFARAIDGLNTAMSERPAGVAGRIVRRLVARGLEGLSLAIPGELDALLPPVLISDRLQAARRAGDWVGTTLALFKAQLMGSRPSVPPGFSDAAEWFETLATTVAALHGWGRASGGPIPVTQMRTALARLRRRKRKTPKARLAGPLAMPRRLASARLAPTRLPPDCRESVARLEVAWRACPDNAWRVFATLHPGGHAPVDGGPAPGGPYDRLAAAARALSPRCRQAVGAVYPVRLDPAQLVVEDGTALIELEFESGWLRATALLGRATGPPELLTHERALPDLPKRIRALLATVAPEGDARLADFPITQAQELYSALLGGIPEVTTAQRWVVSTLLDGTPLPVELLVAAPTACRTLAPGAPAAELSDSCRAVPFVGDRHHVRYALGLRDALAWQVAPPPRPVERAVTVANPIFYHDPGDPRCATSPSTCATLPDLGARLRRLADAGRHRGAPENDLVMGQQRKLEFPRDALRPLPFGSTDATAFHAAAERIGWAATLHQGAEATEGALRDALRGESPTALWVASHLSVPGQSARPSATTEALRITPFGVVLAPSGGDGARSELDGFLTNDELADPTVDLRALRLIVLSGCSGAAPVEVHGARPRSFAQELRGRGAGTILAHAWPLEDRLAARTVSVVERAARTGESIEQALSATRREWRAARPHPAHWSGLVAHGPAGTLGPSRVLKPATEPPPPPVAGVAKSPAPRPPPPEGQPWWPIFLGAMAVAAAGLAWRWRARGAGRLALGSALLLGAIASAGVWHQTEMPHPGNAATVPPEAPRPTATAPPPSTPLPTLTPVVGDGGVRFLSIDRRDRMWANAACLKPVIERLSFFSSGLTFEASRTWPDIHAAMEGLAVDVAHDVIEVGGYLCKEGETALCHYLVVRLSDAELVAGVRGRSGRPMAVWALDWTGIDPASARARGETVRRSLAATHVLAFGPRAERGIGAWALAVRPATETTRPEASGLRCAAAHTVDSPRFLGRPLTRFGAELILGPLRPDDVLDRVLGLSRTVSIRMSLGTPTAGDEPELDEARLAASLRKEFAAPISNPMVLLLRSVVTLESGLTVSDPKLSGLPQLIVDAVTMDAERGILTLSTANVTAAEWAANALVAP